MGWINDSVAAIWGAGQAATGLLRPSAANTPGPGDDYWYGAVGGQNHAGVVVTPDLALKASALFAVVRVLAETMASLPLQMHRELGKDGREPAPNHPLDELIRYQPNSWQTAVEFWEMMMLHAVLRGTAYAEIVPGPRGAVDSLIPLHTDRVRPERLRDGSLRFHVSNPHNGQRRVLLQEEIFRVPGLSSDGVSGLRVVDLAAEAIGLGIAADAYAARVFSNRLNVGGYLMHPGKLGEEAQKNFIQAFTERLAGINNAHRPILLQEGMKFERASDNARDSQLLEARKWQIGEIARFFRVPLHMLNVDDQTNRSTVEAQALDFVKYVVRPWVRRIEQAIRRDLIIVKGTYSAKFNVDALLRGDSASQADYFSKALGSGGHRPWMLVNEVRATLGMNPIEGGDEYDLPVNMQRTDPEKADAVDPERLVRKEVAAVRKASLRFAGDVDGFREWVKAFYGGHVSAVMSLLGIPKEAARTYCDFVRDELLKANDIPALLDRWEDGRATEISKTLRGTEDE